jgi:hypothetical protein
VPPLFRSTLQRLKTSPYRPLFPSIAVLTAVALFWIVGGLGGLAILREPKSPIVTLAVLYGMLFLMACSVVAGAAAATTLTRRLRSVHRPVQDLALLQKLDALVQPWTTTVRTQVGRLRN